MNIVLSFALGAAMLGLTFYILHRRAADRRCVRGPSGILEYRTPLAVDVCMDYLAHKNVNDVFDYTCQRQRDGSFLLHLTLHRATQQPVDTLYALRLDAGRQTVISLIFVREAFGYQMPVFPVEVLNDFLAQKLDAFPIQ